MDDDSSPNFQMEFKEEEPEQFPMAYEDDDSTSRIFHMEFKTEPEEASVQDQDELLDIESVKSMLPAKSSERYLKEYNLFCSWREANHLIGVDEKMMLHYFEDQYKNSKPSCLWSYYAMIRSCLFIHEKVDIKRYDNLRQYLKKKTAGRIMKKPQVLSNIHILRFLKEADDDTYLLLKVILILGVFGGCRRDELINVTTEDVEDCGNFIRVSITKTANQISRSFVITEDDEGCHPCAILRKYMALRPATLNNKRFLIGYRNKKCIEQVVGVHTVGNTPRKIAEYLGLPDANQYTGHCFRRSSASLLVNGLGDLGIFMNHVGRNPGNLPRGPVEEKIPKDHHPTVQTQACQTEMNNHLKIERVDSEVQTVDEVDDLQEVKNFVVKEITGLRRELAQFKNDLITVVRDEMKEIKDVFHEFNNGKK